jgi:hypothetical protein
LIAGKLEIGRKHKSAVAIEQVRHGCGIEFASAFLRRVADLTLVTLG